MSSIEDEVSNASTEETLLKARNSFETITSTRSKCCNRAKESRNKCVSSPIWYLLSSATFLLWGLSTVIWTPFDLLMNERLRMTPGLPPFEWWKIPPDMVLFRVYIFNVTNSEEFLNKESSKLNLVEIGPIIFMEKLTHTNITFNKNSTMTYVATRKAIFLPELNSIDLNATIIVPNWALLGIASYLSQSSFVMKLGFNLLIKSSKPTPFVKLTINQLLWNFTDPLLDTAHKLSPKMVPLNNLGILDRIYRNFTNTVTVYMGTKYGHDKFFLIDKYDGVSHLPNFPPGCDGGVVDSTEGVAYPQYITKNTSIYYWRNTLGKKALLRYQSDRRKYGITLYEFELSPSLFDRTTPTDLDCFKGDPNIPSGLSDISNCHFGFPMATSFPHFLYGDKTLKSYVDGLQPNRTAHDSFLLVEPISGLPFESKARSQSNLIVKKLTGFNEVVKQFSDTVIPMFWLEYNQVDLPWKIIALVYFLVVILPILQRVLSVFLLSGSLIFIYFYIKKKKRERLLRNKMLVFEKEMLTIKP